MCAAIMAGDLIEARFRARLLIVHSDEAGEHSLAIAAARLYEHMDQGGGSPSTGYSVALLALADEIERVEGRSPVMSDVVVSRLYGRQSDIAVIQSELDRSSLVGERHRASAGEYLFAARRYAHRCYKSLLGRLSAHTQ